ncbi:hypothetical protein [Vibrio parahaemolyticus]|uniref:hypothetical protein n=1 Tax=Vibrio parahaemolyticus TaxID=670 RepID=UPI00387B87F4
MKTILLVVSLLSVFSSNVLAKNAEAYCWETKYGKFKCYGPSQKTSSSWENLEKAQEISGCKDAGNQVGLLGVGSDSGAWFTCYDRELQSYDNSPKKIQEWVYKQ